MKKTKNFLALLIATSLSVASICTVNATGNVKDSVYTDYEVTGTAGTAEMKRLGDTRGKWDDSSVYLYVKKSSADKSIWMQVQTCGIHYGEAFNCTLSSRGRKVKWARVKPKEEVIIYNDIYESGFKYADLKIDHNGDTGTVVKFDFNWSPDLALGRYKVADTSDFD